MQITLRSAAPAADRQGKPQWELRVQDPFSSNSDYETKFWIAANEGETAPPPAVYWCILTQGQMKTSKDPSRPFDGSLDWMWRWRIAQRSDFHCPDAPEPPQTQNVVQPTPMAPAGAVNGSTPSPSFDVTRNSIERQTVFKAAASLVVATDLVDQSPEVILGRVRDLTVELWNILQNIGQNIGSDAPPPTESVEVEEFDEEPLPWS
jgi:hypothetical protein